MEERIVAKRSLGNGRWDRALKREMVDLSEADNYDDAKHEWIATGGVWWRSLGAVPSWVQRESYCLCGHHVVYHFEIHNTETNVRRAVGSAHINSNLILRAIREETGLKNHEITEEMIQEWIEVRVEALKTTAWWNVHGEDFTEMFDEVKELDLRLNVRETGKRMWNSDLRMNQPITTIRKKASGDFGSPEYQMASIVWRWNHPDNAKAQINKRGYPNDRLMNDLIMFWAFVEKHTAKVEEEDAAIAKRIEEVSDMTAAENKKRNDYLKQQAVVSSAKKERRLVKFKSMCDYLGIREFDMSDAWNDWEVSFLHDLKGRFLNDKVPTERQASTLSKIIERNDKPVTVEQSSYLVALGYKGEIPDTNRKASILIDEWKNKGSE